MKEVLYSFTNIFYDSLKDLTPIVLVILFFQLVVLQQPLPNVFELLVGILCVVLGLGLFICGLELALFPIGENMAFSLAEKGSVFWLVIFAFTLGFGTTIVEPALTAVTHEAAKIAMLVGEIPAGEESTQAYAQELKYVIGFSVGLSVVISVFRILKGWPIHVVIITGYVLVVVLTLFAPKEIISIAYDSGGVTTSTVTVPLLTALGVGLAYAIKGRNPMTDGFGVIALAALCPIIFVLLYGIVR